MLFSLLSLFTHFFHLILGIDSPQTFPPPLDAQTEKRYFEKAAKGDEDARQMLILHNLRLVSHIVRKYYGTAPNQEDLVSIGSIGLIKAVDSFNVLNGARFATYAAKCIQNEILMYFRSQRKLNNEISINETIDVDRDGNPLTYIDVISSDETVAEDLDRKMQTEKMMRMLGIVLCERERQIIVMRYGLFGQQAHTQKQIADTLGISRSYVSRIEKSALEKLKSALG
jgi:RNA polymerase sporulation-specific sigma factor